MKQIKNVAPTIAQLIRRDLGKYGGNSGVNKLFHLVNAIDSIASHLGIDYVDQEIKKEVGILREYEKNNNIKTIADKIKDWNTFDKILKDLRPKLAEIQFSYDDISEKRFLRKKESVRKININRLVKRVSPFQLEIYWLFNLLMKISNMQQVTIPAEAFRTQQMIEYGRSPFEKTKSLNIPTSENV